MKKIRVGAVSYLNTKPLLYGLRHHPIINNIELIEDYPASIAQQLIEGQIDLGLIPIAATKRLTNWRVVGDYCIGCDGEVASVCLFSEVPIEKIETVYLDYQSRTSVNLAKILLSEYWQKQVKFIDATGEDYRQQIMRTAAGVVIGDRALQQRLVSKHTYDLGAAWKAYTDLPFVFAAWIATTELSKEFEQQFNDANALGLTKVDEVIKANQYEVYDLSTYYKQNINYKLDEKKRSAMRLFLSKLKPF